MKGFETLRALFETFWNIKNNFLKHFETLKVIRYLNTKFRNCVHTVDYIIPCKIGTSTWMLFACDVITFPVISSHISSSYFQLFPITFPARNIASKRMFMFQFFKITSHLTLDKQSELVLLFFFQCWASVFYYSPRF